MKITSWVKVILESLYEGVLIINADAVVEYVNPSYTRITGVAYYDIVGHLLEEVRPGARLPTVLKTGEKILRARRYQDGINYIVNMSPIIEDGKIVGGISMVRGMNDVEELNRALKGYRTKIKHLENRMKTIQRARYSFADIVARDRKSAATREMAEKIAGEDVAVLITGESGTGKELYAQSIHNASPRKNGPFVAINCAAIQADLLESELFGYEQGSFTGATEGGKMGLFAAADGGTLFLDEVSEMDLRVQSKLLRTLQEGQIRPVGSTKEIEIDVRVIAATNRNLENMVSEGSFREDLFYRISVFPLSILPLRERKNDLQELIEYYIEIHENRLERRIDMTSEARSMLKSYQWPGNIRELRNCIEFAVNMMGDYIIRCEDLPRRITDSFEKDEIPVRTLAEMVHDAEANYIRRALEIHGSSVEGKKAAARHLGISLSSLYSKLAAAEDSSD